MQNQGQRLDPSFVDRVCEPVHRDFIRLVHWNIEKGKRWALLERCLDDESIRSADILSLNEADYGMARSGNRHVAFEIAERLGMRVIYAPTFFEFTKGTGDERSAPGENTAAQHGNAVLTRLPVDSFQNIKLPSCHDALQSEEKRAGGRSVLIVKMRAARGFQFTLAATHLEVFTTRKCRARQMQFLLEHLKESPAIIAGDFNTNTFDRGSVWRTIQGLIALLGAGVKTRVQRPWMAEPLFDFLKAEGFTWDQFNDWNPTNIADLSALEDRKYLPAFLVQLALKRGRELPLRLDWIACRGFKAVVPGRTLTALPAEPSDHLPITCDLARVSGTV